MTKELDYSERKAKQKEIRDIKECLFQYGDWVRVTKGRLVPVGTKGTITGTNRIDYINHIFKLMRF